MFQSPQWNRHCVGGSICLYVGNRFVCRAPSWCACSSVRTLGCTSPVCSAEGNHEINIDETATVKRSVWFWSLLPGLMAPCRSDFGFVVERERQGSFSVLAWPEPSVWVGCDSYTDDQSLGNPRPLFVISNTISSSHYTEMHSTISDHYMNMRPGDICTIRLPLSIKS